MKILIVEDDQNKINQLNEFLNNTCPNDSIVIKNSFNSGLKEIISNRADCLILDMSMPTFDKTPIEKGGSFRMYAGKEILRQMERRKIKIPVILVTQFDLFGPEDDRKSLAELSEELSFVYNDMYRGAVYYNPAHNNWKDDLQKKLFEILDRE